MKKIIPKLGDVVRYTGNTDMIGTNCDEREIQELFEPNLSGIVTFCRCDNVTVRFDRHVGGHNGNMCKQGYCWNFDENSKYIEVISPCGINWYKEIKLRNKIIIIECNTKELIWETGTIVKIHKDHDCVDVLLEWGTKTTVPIVFVRNIGE